MARLVVVVVCCSSFFQFNTTPRARMRARVRANTALHVLQSVSLRLDSGLEPVLAGYLLILVF
jgi:hypothetical protein